jgi:hypothetical protein
MATTEIVMLDRTLAYYVDEDDPTNELEASGFHLVDPNVRRKLEDYDHTTMTMSVITTGDELRAAKFLDSIGGFAVFPVYSGTGAETFEGYLVIKDVGSKVCSLDGGIYLGSATTTPLALMNGVIAYLQDEVKKLEYTGAEDPMGTLSAAMTELATLVNFPGM